MAKRRVSWNFALWIAAVPVALAALRIMIFSRGDSALLRVLLETLQVLPILIATTLQVFPWVVLMAGAILLLNASARRAVSPWFARSQLLLVLAILGVMVTLYTSPPTVAIPILAVYLLILVLYVLARIPKPWPQKIVRFANGLDQGDPLSSVFSIIVIPLLFIQFANWNTFWLPREAVTVAAEVRSAYVLNVTGEWTTLLTPDREVLRVPTGDVTARLVCDQGEGGSLLMLGAAVIAQPAECSE